MQGSRTKSDIPDGLHAVLHDYSANPGDLRIRVSISMALIKIAVHAEGNGIRASEFSAVHAFVEAKWQPGDIPAH